MVPLSCDNRLTRQPLQRILHGLMQGCVKALDTAFRRPGAPAFGRDIEPGEPAGDPAALDGIQRRQRGPDGKGRLARSGVTGFQPRAKRTLCESVSWAE
jgi:hypothetical protein